MAKMDPGITIMYAIANLDVEGFLYPAEQKTLRPERFCAAVPDNVERWVRQKLFPIIENFFGLRNVREKKTFELTFLTATADIIYEIGDDEVRRSIERMAVGMRVDVLTAYVMLAIHVKQLGLDHDPPLLTMRGQTITWQEDTHRFVLERQPSNDKVQR